MSVKMILATLIGVLTAGAASAGTVATAPFPGQHLTTGFARCLVTNVGTSDAVVSMELLNPSGTPLAGTREQPVPPGQTHASGLAALSVSSPSVCRFTFKGKIRGSFVYVGDPPVVIPATK